KRPEPLAPALAIFGVAALLTLMRFPACSHVAAPTATRPPHLAVDRGVLDPEREAARALLAEAQKSGDVDGVELANQLNKLLTSIDGEELTRKQAFDKLAELENQYLKASDGELEYLKDKLRKAGTEMSKAKLLKEPGDALKNDDPDKARKE